MACPYGYTPLGFANVTGLSGAVGITPVPPGAVMALIATEGSSVRWRDDGTAPTTTVGMYMAAGQEFQYAGNLAGIQFIQTSTTPATLDVSFYK